jgi:hypothetical protein
MTTTAIPAVAHEATHSFNLQESYSIAKDSPLLPTDLKVNPITTHHDTEFTFTSEPSDQNDTMTTNHVHPSESLCLAPNVLDKNPVTPPNRIIINTSNKLNHHTSAKLNRLNPTTLDSLQSNDEEFYSALQMQDSKEMGYGYEDSDESSGETTPRASLDLEGCDVVDTEGMRIDDNDGFKEMGIDMMDPSYHHPTKDFPPLNEKENYEVQTPPKVTHPPSLTPLSIYESQPFFYPELKERGGVHFLVNLPDHAESLRVLDRVFYHPKLQTQDGYFALPHPSAETDSRIESRENSRSEVRRQEEFINQRFPYISLASRRLQAGMGVRNQTVFEVQTALGLERSPRGPITPVMRRIFSGEGCRGGLQRGGSERDLFTSHHRSHSSQNAIPSGFGEGIVDKETGRRLREYLLQMGKEYGMQTRRCESLVLVDETEEVKNGVEKREVVGGFRESDGGRIEVRVGRL